MKKVPHFQPSSEGNGIQDIKGISYQPLKPIHIHPSLLQLPRPGFTRRRLKCAVPCTGRGNQNTAGHLLSFHTFLRSPSEQPMCIHIRHVKELPKPRGCPKMARNSLLFLTSNTHGNNTSMAFQKKF